MGSKHFQEILEQIKEYPSIKIRTKEEFHSRGNRMGSLLLLFMEHCRLCAIWCKYIKYQYEFVPKKNLIENIVNVQRDEVRFLFEQVDTIKDKFNSASFEGIYQYLSWLFYEDKIYSIVDKDLPNPIEPLWVYTLRGGELRYEQGPIIVTLLHISRLPKIDMLCDIEEPFININDIISLDKADKAFLDNPELFIKNYIDKYTGGNSYLVSEW